LPILRWRCAHGEAPAVTLACARTVEIAPLDDAVDSNVVRIEGGRHHRMVRGEAPPVIKRVLFQAGITLKHNPPQLSLLCCVDRYITTPAIGLYASGGDGCWSEVHFTETGTRELSRRIDSILERLEEIERRLEPMTTDHHRRKRQPAAAGGASMNAELKRAEQLPVRLDTDALSALDRRAILRAITALAVAAVRGNDPVAMLQAAVAG